uniref:Uncharacterized protein n=1 Tax=Acrobeloides nanus TaxID=290746 RepID=A0A914CIR0_9BILA
MKIASNIVLPNGSLDPWSPLGCNVTDNAVHRIAITTTGGAHCVDMFPYSKSSLNSVEPDAVEKTIDVIKQNVAYFLTLSSPFEKNPPQKNL